MAKVFVPLSLFSLIACSSTLPNPHLQDAERFCDVFSPNSWKEMKSQYQGAKLMEELLRRVDHAVETPEFEAIMDQQHLQPKDPESLYGFYVREVSKLTGKPFACDDLKVYFEQAF